jgi:hypothetical protein
MGKDEEIVGVVGPQVQGSGGSFYVLIPLKIREKLHIDEKSEFVVILSGKDIIYRKKEA